MTSSQHPVLVCGTNQAQALNDGVFDPEFVKPKLGSGQEMSGFRGAKWRGLDKDRILLIEPGFIRNKYSPEDRDHYPSVDVP